MELLLEVAQKEIACLGTFELESGNTIARLNVCFETWGELNSRRSNALLIVHALTGTSHATGNGVDQAGWWETLVGPGKVFDTNRYFIICANTLGGCSGTTGPSSENPLTGRIYGSDFPVISIRDMVAAQKRLLDYLEIPRLCTVAGGSMGGMQALEWAALYPEYIDSAIVIAAPGRAYPQSIAYRKAQRKAIMEDPAWYDGHYYGLGFPRKGLELARFIGFISYRSEQEFSSRFERRHPAENPFCLEARFEVESYLEYHGRKLSDWFDANTYLYLSKAMDLHDLGRERDSFAEGIRRIQAPLCMIGIDSDLLFPCHQQKEVVDILSQTHPECEYHEINSPYGHDGFLIEHEQISKVIEPFLEGVATNI